MRIPLTIRIIITVNVVVFIFQSLGGSSFNQILIRYFAFDPDLFTAITQPWRFLTYLSLHGSGWHLLFNMLWLWWMGRSVEESLGPRTFAVLYLGAGIGGALLDVGLSLLVGGTYVIGASGAVYGIMVAFAVMFPRMPIMLFLLPPIEARFLVVGLIAFDLLFLGAGDSVARIVHLGGAGVGYILIKAHYSGYDLSAVIRFFETMFTTSSKKRQKIKKNKKMYSVSDVEIMEESNSDELDEILEKISKSGYDGLTPEEKKKLFELSKRN